MDPSQRFRTTVIQFSIAILLLGGYGSAGLTADECLTSSALQSSTAANRELVNANRLAAHKQYSEATAKYKLAIAREPQNPDCHHLYGRTLALSGKFVEAIDQYRRALQLKPDNYEIYNDIGVALAINGATINGAKFIKRSVDLKPQYITGNNNLGAVLTRLGDYEQAAQFFSHSLAMQPNNSVIQDRYKEARTHLSESVHFDFGPPLSLEAIDGLSQLPGGVWLASSPLQVPTGTRQSPTGGGGQDSHNFGPAIAAKGPPSVETVMKDAEGWLQSGQPLFLELRVNGFTSANVSGTGLIQQGENNLSGDEITRLDLSKHLPIELSGDLLLEFSGKGEVQLGKFKVRTLGEDGRLSIDCGQEMLTCRSGTFEISNWPSVIALRDGKRVLVTAGYCEKIYAQDDAIVKATHCSEVSLVSMSSGTIIDCDELLLNDNARGLAIRCDQVAVMGSAKVRILDCGDVEQHDRGQVEFAKISF
jgi:Tfp pilus assembly protein PilF